MKIFVFFPFCAGPMVSALFLLIGAVGGLRAAEVSAVVDDFSDPARNSLGVERVVISDQTAGGASELRSAFADGVLAASGDIVPARGQPGWVSLTLVLKPGGEAVDVSRYEGIRLRVRLKQGMLSVSANSAEVTNFDYHAALVAAKPGEFTEVKIPFRSMKRAWSEQTALNPATIQSISLVAVDFQKNAFAYDVDEVGFY